MQQQRFRALLISLILLVVVAGCDITPAETIATPIPSRAIANAPTPPRHAPIVIVTAPTPRSIAPTSTPTTEPKISVAEVIFLPSPTPESATQTDADKAVALQDIGIAAIPDTANPLATIALQLEQPISIATASTPGIAPPMPTPQQENQSPLPVVAVAPAPLQIPVGLVWDGIQRTAYVPILMYHYVSTPPANADIYRKDLSVAPELFTAQLDRIQSEGYTTITLYDLVAHLLTGSALPEKPVIITFDDGYRDNYENAFPALKARGMRATFLIVIDFVNNQRPEYMTWDMLRELYASGMSIEAHGIDHSSLKKRERDFLIFQALRSYETLQNEIGQRARFVSYPAGQYDQNTIEAFKSADYWAGITTIQGATHSIETLFELRRVRIRGTTSPDELVRLLATDW